MKTYRSRISLRLVFFLALVCIISGAPALMHGDYITGLVMILIFALVFLLMKSIKYVIDGHTLKVYYFFGIHQDIDINTIRKMEASRCILSSPAASLKRLAIHYNKYDVVYISPRNQEDFIKQIKLISPAKL